MKNRTTLVTTSAILRLMIAVAISPLRFPPSHRADPGCTVISNQASASYQTARILTTPFRTLSRDSFEGLRSGDYAGRGSNPTVVSGQNCRVVQFTVPIVETSAIQVHLLPQCPI